MYDTGSVTLLVYNQVQARPYFQALPVSGIQQRLSQA